MRLAGVDGGPLLAWYDANGRDLPWRRTREPYSVWVSEIMLQQTQVATALPYYERWMRELPTLKALVQCDEERLLSLWEGLGYYRRARLLQEGAKCVLDNGWPISAKEWLAVPGVGPYTAAAIASICLNEPSAVVDGNVERVYARICADGSSGSALLKNARVWAQSQVFDKRPGDWNQAMMELGATICTPRNPKCDQCPIEDNCAARQSWRVDDFPVRIPKPETIEMRFQIEIPYDGERFGVRPVESARWWKGMWEFPTVSEPPPYPTREDEEGFGGGVGSWTEYVGEIRHAVTQHRLIYSVSLSRVEELDPSLRAATIGELQEIPLPAPQRKALKMAANSIGLIPS